MVKKVKKSVIFYLLSMLIVISGCAYETGQTRRQKNEKQKRKL